MLPHSRQIRNCKYRRSPKKTFLHAASLKQIIRIAIRSCAAAQIRWPRTRDNTEGNAHAWIDARLAIALPSYHRPRGPKPSRAARRHTLGRGAHSHNKLQDHPGTRLEGREAAQQGWHRTWRPSRHFGLEHVAPSGGLVWHPRHWSNLSHRQ